MYNWETIYNIKLTNKLYNEICTHILKEFVMALQLDFMKESDIFLKEFTSANNYAKMSDTCLRQAVYMVGEV